MALKCKHGPQEPKMMIWDFERFRLNRCIEVLYCHAREICHSHAAGSLEHSC